MCYILKATKCFHILFLKKKEDKTRLYRRVVNHLNKVARNTKQLLNQKYKNKIEHLKDKYNKNDDDEDEPAPDDLSDYAGLSVFNNKKYEEIVTESYEVKIIGDVTLSEDEQAVLKLHNKFSILEKLLPGGIDTEQEASNAKIRMEREKTKTYEDFTEEERKEDEEITAKNRMIYDPKTKTFDNRKRRVTDLQQCARITLPKPLTPEEESKLEVRKRIQKETYEKYRVKNTNKKGEQKNNLTKNEESGLKSLLKRIEKEEIIVMKTDKSGRFVVTTPDKYKEMGEEHTNKDEEIEWNTVREMERRINSHTIAWELIWNTGEDHKHQDRIIRSKATRSGNQANLTLLYKDHKVGDKTRPVASGNESYNLGLSNGLSEVMESVAKAIKSPYSVISAEDMLARIHIYNASITGKDEKAGELKASTVPPEKKENNEPSGRELRASTVPPEDE